MILAICLAAAALLGVAVVATLGIIGYRRLDRGLLDVDDRVDELGGRLGMPVQPRPSAPTSLYDHRPEEI